jgi:hypothetical protein
MTMQADLDARIASVRQAGLTPVMLVLSYTDHWKLSYELGGPDVGYVRPGAYFTLAPSYRGLEIVRPSVSHDAAPVIGVREA